MSCIDGDLRSKPLRGRETSQEQVTFGQCGRWSVLRKNLETFGQNPCEVGRPRKNSVLVVSAEKKLGDLRSKALAGEDNVLHRWRPSVKTLARSGDLARTGPRKNRATIPVWNGEIFAQVPVMLK